MKEYFRDKDGLGTWPKMNYKGKEMYGTTVGGMFSCAATLFVWFYVCTVLGAFLFGAKNYNQTTSFEF